MSNPVLDEIYARREVSDSRGNTHRLHSEITRDEGEMMMNLIESRSYSRGLEVGCAYGLSSLFVCQALSRQSLPRHTIIDPFQNSEWHGIGLANLTRAGFDFYELIEKPSEFALPALVQDKRTFQFALIDGMHTFDHALVDFFYVDRLLEPGGTVVFDDLQLPAIKRLTRYIAGYPNYRVCATAKRSVYPAGIKRKAFEAPLRFLARTLPRHYVSQVFSDSFFRSDAELGLVSEMVAFEKTGVIERGIHWYTPF
jgi:predicted O-methyltransferase YrrM